MLERPYIDRRAPSIAGGVNGKLRDERLNQEIFYSLRPTLDQSATLHYSQIRRTRMLVRSAKDGGIGVNNGDKQAIISAGRWRLRALLAGRAPRFFSGKRAAGLRQWREASCALSREARAY